MIISSSIPADSSDISLLPEAVDSRLADGRLDRLAAEAPLGDLDNEGRLDRLASRGGWGNLTAGAGLDGPAAGTGLGDLTNEGGLAGLVELGSTEFDRDRDMGLPGAVPKVDIDKYSSSKWLSSFGSV